MRKRLLKALVGLAAFGAFTALPAAGQNPYQQPDESWITIDGTVQDVQRDRFALDYGDGTIQVEMDDGDRDADAYKLVPGDSVTVSGMIDDDFLETTTIEASWVRVKNLNTTFYSSALDEEEYQGAAPGPFIMSRATLQGTVTDVDQAAEEFTLSSGSRAITVDVSQLAYDPLDDEGYQKIDAGDRVTVVGSIDYNLFGGRELEADAVVTLHAPTMETTKDTYDR